ncbi:MAG: PAC2 family protein [Thermoproteota archaeon]
MEILARRKTRKAGYAKDPKKEFFSQSEEAGSQVVPQNARGISLNEPVLLVAFLDAGLIGPMALDYIIHQVSMHEVAFVKSHHVAPATVFIAGQFRHPFRIYSNKEGTVCIAVCEVPVLPSGVHSIAESVSGWCIRSKVRELVLVAGIARDYIPGVTEKESPVAKVYLLQNHDDDGDGDAGKERKALQAPRSLPGGGSGAEETADMVSINERIKAKVLRPSIAIIPGVAGSLLASCAVKKMKCTSVLVPQNETGIDPEGALLMIELLNKLIPTLNIDTSVFKQESEMMKKLQDLMKARLSQLKEYERIVGRSDIERIYR